MMTTCYKTIYVIIGADDGKFNADIRDLLRLWKLARPLVVKMKYVSFKMVTH